MNWLHPHTHKKEPSCPSLTHSLTTRQVNFGTVEYSSAKREWRIVLDGNNDAFQLDGEMIDLITNQKRDLNSLHNLAKTFLSNPTKPFPNAGLAFININNLVAYCRKNGRLSAEHFATKPNGPMPCTVEDQGKAVSFTTVLTK